MGAVRGHWHQAHLTVPRLPWLPHGDPQLIEWSSNQGIGCPVGIQFAVPAPPALK